MNNKQLDALIRKGADKMVGMGDSLYFRIARGRASWVVKYMIAGKRAQIALPISYPTLSISEARLQALEIKQKVKIGIDPKSERKKAGFHSIHNMNDLFTDWYSTYALKHLKEPSIPQGHYNRGVRKHIGVMAINDVTPHHVKLIIDNIVESNRRSIANKTLQHLKQLFNHAIKLNLITFNPAQAFKPKDAGGIEYSRSRYLRLDEINYAFRVMRESSPEFSRDNYLACCMLLCFGCRKGELITAKWEDIDLSNKVWHCIPNKQPKNAPIKRVAIPIPDLVIPWFIELKFRSGQSNYLFPARQKSKQGHISADTVNSALQKLMGRGTGNRKAQYENRMPNIEHFTLHDLRRTCRSLLSEIGISEHISERCLNHKQKGVVGVYDRYHYFTERKSALEKLSKYIHPHLINEDSELSSETLPTIKNNLNSYT